jgi:diadenosine tetraphosphatase ApaH/serine/threonine PP2A family protein phosphatase
VAGKCFLEGLKLVYKKDELTLVHGTLAHPDEFGYMTTSYTAEESFSLLETKICFVGHTHWLGTFVQDKSGILGFSADTKINIKEGCRYIVNVGSVGQPRDNNPKAAYCIYDTDKNQIEIKRANYDIKTAYKKIIAAGLPEYLGNRLLRGD